MIKESFEIETEPITPVFIWNGEILYSKADYNLVNDKVVIVDPVKALGKIRELKDAFKEEFARAVQGYKLIFPSTTLPGNILMTNDYLIPASSLKGLIRTAIVNRLAKADPKVYNQIDANLNMLMTLSRHDAMRRVRDVARPVEELLQQNVVFGKSKYNYHALNRLIISDPRITDPELSLKKVLIIETVGTFRNEVFVIALEKGKLTYDIKILQPVNYGPYSYLKILDDKITKNEIIASLKEYGQLVVEREKKKVSKTDKDFKKYMDFLGTLKVEGDCIPLKIGMLTGHIAKTISLPSNTEQDREQVMTKLTGHLWDNRTVKLTDAMGVGWIKLCIR
ncbi:type III-A CRISPR-associated RAMP protein Csm5 [Candidatus Marsarchaeota G2 archaeon ECH_B_SAG-C16]|uniref:CRISPR system Cms protein Csm5 n=3 Tax=Candidatus Marsarchaeota group 2 TaxID=2203771 RepID=A0A2R6CDE0_9ARCH|nr:MAG: type III-A CRISPR-associated RAMP protein Csm5 [Candidatus Marsarchaeota G2 archaeon ECH_B_SAG-C16]PSO08796.1 MAG: type III-A CRISPR-associated RAMP protein Csm5 [Candidatus Marsarchaeota G2 archaeon BE_D]